MRSQAPIVNGRGASASSRVIARPDPAGGQGERTGLGRRGRAAPPQPLGEPVGEEDVRDRAGRAAEEPALAQMPLDLGDRIRGVPDLEHDRTLEVRCADALDGPERLRS